MRPETCTDLGAAREQRGGSLETNIVKFGVDFSPEDPLQSGHVGGLPLSRDEGTESGADNIVNGLRVSLSKQVVGGLFGRSKTSRLCRSISRKY